MADEYVMIKRSWNVIDEARFGNVESAFIDLLLDVSSNGEASFTVGELVDEGSIDWSPSEVEKYLGIMVKKGIIRNISTEGLVLRPGLRLSRN